MKQKLVNKWINKDLTWISADDSTITAGSSTCRNMDVQLLSRSQCSYGNKVKVLVLCISSLQCRCLPAVLKHLPLLVAQPKVTGQLRCVSPVFIIFLEGKAIPTVEREIFRTCPDRLWGPPSLLYNGYRVFPGGKAAGAWRWPPTAIPLLHFWAFVACYRVNFKFCILPRV